MKSTSEHKTSFYENLPVLREKQQKLNERIIGCGHELRRLQVETCNVKLVYDELYAELEAVEDLLYEIEQAEK